MKRHYYSPEQQAELDRRMWWAMLAEGLYSLDELEEYAAQQRRKEQDDERLDSR
jgi:hypothetical protein